MAPSKIRRELGLSRRGGWPEVKHRWWQVVAVLVVVVVLSVLTPRLRDVRVMVLPVELEEAEEEGAIGIAAVTIECGDPLSPSKGIAGEMTR